MSAKNVAAWTGQTPKNPSQYVQYISINTGQPFADKVTITVRDRESNCVEIEMSRNEFKRLLQDANGSVAQWEK